MHALANELWEMPATFDSWIEPISSNVAQLQIVRAHTHTHTVSSYMQPRCNRSDEIFFFF